MSRRTSSAGGNPHNLVFPAARSWRLRFALGLTSLFLAGTVLRRPARAAETAPGLAPVQLSPERRQLIGLQFATVEEKQVKDRIRTTGLVEPDEQSEGYVQTRFAGWIKDAYVNQTYQYVRRGQPLFTIYSPDLVSAEQEYLLALNAAKRLRTSEVEGVASGAEALVQAALERMKLFGVAPSEISRLKRERTVRNAIVIDSPMSGYVMDWSALPGKYVQPGARLYTIANLSKVWVYAAIFQNQIGEVKTGDSVSVSVDAYPDESFKSQVDFIWRAMDPTTRTARVRCVVANPDGRLKLGMYVNIVLSPRLGRALVIPDSGVFRTGTHDIAFVDRGNGYFQPVEVELGAHAGREFVVRKGLRAGDRIVSSANFLIDSESQLQAAIGSFAPPPPGVSAAATTPAAAIDVSTEPSPLHMGDNRILISLHSSSGQPVSDAQVSMVFFMPAMPAMGMSAMRVQATAHPGGDGRYTAAVKLPSGGAWNVTVVAKRADRQIASRQLSMSATGGM